MKFIYQTWWKVITVVLILSTFITGLIAPVPTLPVLHETIRNLYFHVPMWMGMLSVFVISVFYSIRYLNTGKEEYDLAAVECVNTGLVFFTLGLLTGMMWAKYTWGEFWSGDPKQNSAAIAFLLYCAYIVLRNSIDEEQKRAKISAIYNIFAFPIMIVLIFVLPRMTDSLHPGSGGNPAFGKYDLDNGMKIAFYPAMLGWSFLAVWVATLRYRIRLIENKKKQHKLMKHLSVLALLILGYVSAFAQPAQAVEMGDAFRSSGKIYVVIAVIVIIFIGLSIYLFSIDRRLKKIEKEK